MRVNYAIVVVSDMSRSVSFYRDVIGLTLRFESPGWTEFATEGATLALHAESSSESKKDDSQNLAGRCRPGFAVPDLDQFHEKMIENRITCIQSPTERLVRE